MPLMLPSMIQARRRSKASGPQAPKVTGAATRLQKATAARGARSALLSAKAGVRHNGQAVARPKLDRTNPRAVPVQLAPKLAPTHRIMHRPAARMVSDLQRLPSGIPFTAAPRSLTVTTGQDVVPAPVIRPVSAIEESRISKYAVGAPPIPYREIREAQALPQVTIHSMQSDVLEAARPGRSAREEAMLVAARRVVEKERRDQRTGLVPPGLRPQGRGVAPPAVTPTPIGPGTLAERIPDQPVVYLPGDTLAEEQAGALATEQLAPLYAAETSPPSPSPSLLRRVAPWALGLAALAILAR